MDTGKRIEKVILEAGSSKTAFAKSLEINKSFLLRVINGEKKMSEQMLEKILKLTILSQEQKDLIADSYFSDTFGAEDFAQMRLVLDNINGFADEVACRKTVYVRTALLDEILCNRKTSYILGNESELYEFTTYFIRQMLEKENAVFYSNYSFSQEKLDSVLYSLFAERDLKKSLDFVHLVNIPKRDAAYEITSIFKAMKWASVNLNTYALSADKSDRGDIFPYYILTNDCVLTFSEDCSQGLLSTDRAVIDYYQNNFGKTRQPYAPMNDFYYTEIDLMQATAKYSQYNLLYTINGYLCLGPALDYEILNSAAKKDLPRREMLIRSTLNHYEYSNYSVAFPSYHALNSLKQFSKDGQLVFISQRYVNALSPEMRCRIFRNLIDLIENKELPFHIVDDSKLNIPNNMTIDIYNSTILFSGILQGLDNIPDPDLPRQFVLKYDTGRLLNTFNHLFTYFRVNNYTFSHTYIMKKINDFILENTLGD